MRDHITMKARVILLLLSLSLISFFSVNLYGQQQPLMNEETLDSRLESLEVNARELQRVYDNAREEAKQTQKVAQEARDAERQAQEALKNAQKALKAEKKAQKARVKANDAMRRSTGSE